MLGGNDVSCSSGLDNKCITLFSIGVVDPNEVIVGSQVAFKIYLVT